MKVLLVDPPYQRIIGYYRFYFPLGLTYIAAVLEQAGHEVMIYDAEHDPNCISPTMKDTAIMHPRYAEALRSDEHPVWSEYIQVLNEFRPQMVGISVLSVKVAAANKIAALTKRHDKNIIVIAGGDHVTVRPQDMFGHNVDHIVSGEGEQGVLCLVKSIIAGECPPQTIHAPLIEELDVLPLPGIDNLRNVASYRPIDLGLMMTARGCPYSCTFCALSTIWSRKVRHHSTDRVIREIKLRRERYGTNFFSFRNGTFTLIRSKVVQFCRRLLEEYFKIEWECLTRVDAIDGELLQLMRQAGCRTIRVGVESGSEKILKYMDKNISLPQIRVAAKILNQSGIFWSAYFILGVPIETEETIRSTLTLITLNYETPFRSRLAA